MEEKQIFVIRPSKILAIDDWILGGILSLLWVFFGPAIVMIVLALFPSLGPLLPSAALWVFFIVPGLVPLIWAGWRNLKLHCTIYEVTDQRIIRRTGVLTAVYDEIELLRVRDFRIVAPLYLRMFGLGNLHIWGTDRNTRFMVIQGQPNIRDLRDRLRQLVLDRQRYLGYREVDVGGGG